MKRLGLVAALALLGACAAPASYEGLSGGAPEVVATTEDPALEPPRQLSPVSVSFIASSRPRLRWDLGLPGATKLTGAIVEMSRSRDFMKDVKHFEATGSELVVPEDLALGVWFWRLKGAAVGTFGRTTSPTWELVVRGPAAHGSSDLPTRSMNDMNGDGEPDLLIGAMGDDGGDPGKAPVGDQLPGPSAGGPTGKPLTSPMLFFYAGDKERGFLGSPIDGFQSQPVETPYDGPISVGAGTDFNGDGFTDLIESGTFSGDVQGKRAFEINIIYASQKAELPFDYDTVTSLYLPGAAATSLPSVREAADIDGDGYGDAVVGIPEVSFMVIGSKLSNVGPPGLLPIYPTSDGPLAPPTSSTSRIAMAGFDANGDGLGDVLFSLDDTYDPSARAFAAAGDRNQKIGMPRMIDAPDARFATAFTAGDFNGDGLDDIAVTTPVNDSSRVCIWFGSREKLVTPGPCVMAPAGEKDFGASLTAADLEGDGVDELLVTAVAAGVDGVRAVRVGGDGALTVAPVGVPGLGVRLATIWPGRPGKARWAAVAADGSRIGIYEGSDLRASMVPPLGVVRGFGRAIR